MQRRSGQLILLLYLVAKIFLTYKKPLNILHTTKRKFLSILSIWGKLLCDTPAYNVKLKSRRLFEQKICQKPEWGLWLFGNWITVFSCAGGSFFPRKAFFLLCRYQYQLPFFLKKWAKVCHRVYATKARGAKRAYRGSSPLGKSILFFPWAFLFAYRSQINPILPCYALPCRSQIKGQKEYQREPVFLPKVGTWWEFLTRKRKRT